MEMERIVPKRNKSVKFSPGTSEDGSEDEAGKHVSRIRKPARPQKPGHLSIQHGLSNAHLVLRRYAALDGFGTGEVPDDEHEILNSPKVAPAQPVDRCSLTFNLHCLHSYRLQYSMSIWQTALKQELPVRKSSHACTIEHVIVVAATLTQPNSGLKTPLHSKLQHPCAIISYQQPVCCMQTCLFCAA